MYKGKLCLCISKTILDTRKEWALAQKDTSQNHCIKHNIFHSVKVYLKLLHSVRAFAQTLTAILGYCEGYMQPIWRGLYTADLEGAICSGFGGGLYAADLEGGLYTADLEVGLYAADLEVGLYAADLKVEAICNRFEGGG